MSIKKYISEKDTTIADAYKADLKTRSTDANLGASDSLEVFSIYGQASQNSLEKSRILLFAAWNQSKATKKFPEYEFDNHIKKR